MELNKILKDKKTDVAVITETKKKLKATKGFKDYILWFTVEYHKIGMHVMEWQY